MGRTARISAEEDDLLEQLTQQVWLQVATADQAGVKLERSSFLELHPALQRRVLRKAAQAVVPTVELEARHIDLALGAIEAGARRRQLPGGLWWIIQQDHLRLTTEA